MGKYIFAPAGSEVLISLLPRHCLEVIGSIHGKGCGSNFAKGKRFLKYEVGCSSNAVKYAVSTKLKLIGHDINIYGLKAYYYHTDYCADIVYKIIMFMIENCNDYRVKKLLGERDYENIELLEKIYSSRIEQLRWVNRHDYIKQAKQAEQLIERFDELFA